MNKTALRRSLAVISMLPMGAISTQAQTAPSPEPAAAAAPSDEEVVVLDPFTVTTEHEGYQAVDTLGGARVRTKLADTPSSLTVVTSKLLRDLGINNAQDLLIYTNNTEVAGMNGNFSGMSSNGFGITGAAESRRLANPTGTTRSRGLTAMDNTRNYFLSEIPWDGYNISRVDISRGPNSFLFGVGSPSGIANASTNDAMFKTQGSVEGHYGSFGTTREALDYNYELLPSELAIRVDLVNDETRFQQEPAYNHSKRAYAALRFDPKFLSTSSAHTKIQFNIENGRVDSNNPRTLPPLDYLSGYFAAGVNQAGYDPFSYVMNTSNAGFDSTKSPWVYNSDIHYAWGNNSTYYYDGSSGNLLKATQGGVGSNLPTPVILGLRNQDTSSNNYHLYTTGFRQHAINADYAWLQANGGNDDGSPYPGAYARTVTYIDKTLTDDSVFDFYNKLIDGPNKREWQRWNVYTASLTQSLFNERLVIQAVANHEEYRRGQEGLMLSYWVPYISVDLDANTTTYPSWLTSLASANANVGRPFIGGDSGGNGCSESKYTHDNYQLTAAYTLKADDLMSKGWLTDLLGYHDLTALGGKYITEQENRSWQMYASDLDFGVGTGLGKTLSARGLNWVVYLGDSLKGKGSAAGSDLSNLSTRIVPTTGMVTVFDNTWTATSVDSTSPWTNPVPTGALTQTQRDNPANYAGYRAVPSTVLSADGDIDQLYTLGDKRRQTITSQAFLYQGHFWDDTIIPSFGWRKDRVCQRGTTATIDATTGVASMNYDLTDEGVVDDTISKSYGIAIHLPKAIRKNLPEGTDLSFYYFHGSNQTPKIRYSFDGSMLPNEKGETDDYSVQIDALKGRATLRLTYFETKDSNATISSSSPLGSNTWLLDSLPSWTLTFAACGALAANNTVENLPQDLQWQSWLWGWAQSNPTLANQIAEAIKTEFPKLFPQTYWDQYGLPVSASAIAAGDWAHVLSNGAAPLPWNISNTHLIHGTSPILDVNLESKGWELEATVRPITNLELTFNASRVSAQQTSLGAAADYYLNNMARLWLNTAIGKTPEWGNVNSPVSNEFMSGLWAPYLTQIKLNGADMPELRKWNFKLIGNYRFDKGFLNGFNVGGAFRWASAPIVGYGIKKDTVWGNQAWVFDIENPYYGDADSHYDAWVGYQHKLTEKVDWRVQLNLRNVGEKAHLVTTSVEPDGSIAQQRIENGMTYDLSLKFMF